MPWSDTGLIALVIMATNDHDLDFTTAIQVAKMNTILDSHKEKLNDLHVEFREARVELNAKIDKHESDERPRLQRLERLSYYALGAICIIGAVLGFIERHVLF